MKPVRYLCFSPPFAVLWFVVCALFFTGCKTNGEEKNLIVKALISDPDAIFKRFAPNQIAPADSAIGAFTLTVQDPLGRVYVWKPVADQSVELEFYWNENRALQSVVANVLIENEIEAKQVYEKLIDRLEAQNGLPTGGGFGDFVWENRKNETALEAKLSQDKKAITLNYFKME